MISRVDRRWSRWKAWNGMDFQWSEGENTDKKKTEKFLTDQWNKTFQKPYATMA